MKKLLLTIAVTALATAALAAAPANTYVYQTIGGIDTLDPPLAYDTASGEVLGNIYETLYSYQGESITEFEPALATSYEISDDEMTYTFHLRDGVKFHSGNTMTCRDVEYSIERDLVVNSSDSGVWFLAESLLGTTENADNDESVTWERIDAAVECADDMTVVFTLDHIDPAFFAKLMFVNASVVDSAWAIDQGMWDGTEATWRDWVGRDMRQEALQLAASGTGAYRLLSAGENRQVAEAFPDYWGGEPPLKNVIIEAVEDQSSRILSLKAGDADRIDGGDLATVLTQLEGAPYVQVLSSPDWASTSVGVVFFNQKIVEANNSDIIGSGQLDGTGIPGDFFSDIDVRKCFAYSFDQQTFIDHVLVGHGEILTMALPASFLGYDPDLPVYDLDPEKAEEHCRAAWDGQLWDKGFTFTATYNEGNTSRQAALEIIKANIEDLNPKFTMDVRGIAWPDFLELQRNEKASAFVLGWAPDYADSNNYIDTFYLSTGYFAKSYGFNNPEMDALINAANATTDMDERASLYNQVGQLAYDLAPVVPYPANTPFLFVSEALKGAYFNNMYGSGGFLWKDVSK
jgi:peptide/nickel transport system substrate-binding protein